VEDRLDKLEKENGALRKQLNHLKKHLRYIKSRSRAR